MVAPDFWTIYRDELDEFEDFQQTGQLRPAVVARVDHTANRFTVTYVRTNYVVASAQWLPDFKNGRGTWEVYGPDVVPQLHYSTTDAMGAAYGFVLEYLERG